jgi:hypothetical protein
VDDKGNIRSRLRNRRTCFRVEVAGDGTKILDLEEADRISVSFRKDSITRPNEDEKSFSGGRGERER